MKKEIRSSAPEFLYTGDLHEKPLPEVLFTIAQYKVPGVVSFRQKSVLKQIHIRDRRILYATSNAQEDHLGEFLFRCGKISRAHLDESTKILKRSRGRRQGQILVEMKALSQQELEWAVRSHQQSIVWSLFNWFEGEMQFKVGSFKRREPILLDLPISRAILDGVRNIQNAKRIIAFVGSRTTLLEVEKDGWVALELVEANEKEREIFKRIDGRTTLYELCGKSPYGSHETAKILYGFMILKLIRKKQDGIRILSSLTGT